MWKGPLNIVTESSIYTASDSLTLISFEYHYSWSELSHFSHSNICGENMLFAKYFIYWIGMMLFKQELIGDGLNYNWETSIIILFSYCLHCALWLNALGFGANHVNTWWEYMYMNRPLGYQRCDGANLIPNSPRLLGG